MSARDITRSKALLREIEKAELKKAPEMWRLADLTASMVGEEEGQITLSQWAEEIRWTTLGRDEVTLAEMAELARSWPGHRRIHTASFWQHREVLDRFDGDVEQAGAWLYETTHPRYA